MKRNIQIEALAQIPLEKQQIELVERKCLGHPDSMADGIAESISRALCKEYLEEFGVVLHHNTDQGEIVAGESDPKFGGGKIIRPIFILIDGRATKRFNDISIPTDAIAVEATRKYLRTNFTDTEHGTRCHHGLPSWDRIDRSPRCIQAPQRQGPESK